MIDYEISQTVYVDGLDNEFSPKDLTLRIGITTHFRTDPPIIDGRGIISSVDTYLTDRGARELHQKLSEALIEHDKAVIAASEEAPA